MHIQNNKQYNFALSSFVRMYGQSAIRDYNIQQFCIEWSEWEVNAPLPGLDDVDQYFYYEYKNWRGR